MEMIEKSTLKFLKDLDANNDRDWFISHKPDFERANANLVEFVGYLIGEIAKFDEAIYGLDPRACVFRIYRDVRFSKDKRPYKNNLGAYLSLGGRKSMHPGYYFHIQPGQCFIAGGKHMPDGPETLKIRTAIADKTDEFLKIVEKKSFHEQLGEMRGNRLKSAPKGFDAGHKAVEYLKLKEFMGFKELHDDKFLTSAEFPKFLVGTMKAMYPLVNFLRNSLSQ